MTMSCWSRPLPRTARGSLFGLVVLGVFAQGSARAQDQEGASIWNLDKRLYRGIMNGLGFRDGSEPSIEFRERSPLVVPPSRNLPPPQANAGARNRAWPQDPDVARREVKRKPVVAYDMADPIERNGVVLMPSEVNRSVPARNASPHRPGAPNDDNEIMAPSQLGYFGAPLSWFKSGFGLVTPEEEVGAFNTEPPRTSLTAPPTGYQTPSPAQPYGFVKRPEYQRPTKTEDLVVGKPGQ